MLSQRQTRRVWAMLSIAVRIAQGMSLHSADPPYTCSPFEQEMRRRLWSAICLLDLIVALDPAFDPMMQAPWLQSHPPSNINDDEIWPKMDKPVKERINGQSPDMNFSLMVLSAQNIIRALSFYDFTESYIKLDVVREQFVEAFRQRWYPADNQLLVGLGVFSSIADEPRLHHPKGLW